MGKAKATKGKVVAAAKKPAKPNRGAPTELTAADKAALAALDETYAVLPDLPVANITHEARELAVIFKKLGAQLVKKSDVGKDAGKELALRLSRLERAEAGWSAARQIRTPKELLALRKRAEKVKRDAFEALRYFAKRLPEVQTRLKAIAAGTGDADLIDDLKRLAELVAEHGSLLTKAELPANPATALDDLAKELSQAVADRDVSPEAIDAIGLRNQAYWHLREHMDDVRDAGNYVFRADPANRALFRSSLTRARERSGKGKKEPNT